MAEFTWLTHPDIGIPWECPTSAVGFWTPRGWEPCDPPDEVDPTKEPAPPAEQVVAGETQQPEATRAPEPTAVVSDEADDTTEGTE